MHLGGSTGKPVVSLTTISSGTLTNPPPMWLKSQRKAPDSSTVAFYKANRLAAYPSKDCFPQVTTELQEFLIPLNWIKDATIYTKRNVALPENWLQDNADAIVLLFTANGVDRNNLVEKLCYVYEDIKGVNVPLEVIYIPMDETAEDAKTAYNKQANWFTLAFEDPIIYVLRTMYHVTCIPYIYVVKPDCTLISNHGMEDLETYGKNAVITWLSPSTSMNQDRNWANEKATIYGNVWNYLPKRRNSLDRPKSKQKHTWPSSAAKIN